MKIIQPLKPFGISNICAYIEHSARKVSWTIRKVSMDYKRTVISLILAQTIVSYVLVLFQPFLFHMTATSKAAYRRVYLFYELGLQHV
jgi:hypothetical protein